MTPKDSSRCATSPTRTCSQASSICQDLLTYADGAAYHYYNGLFSWTHTFNDRVVNNLIFSYQQGNDSRGPTTSSINVVDLAA